MAESQDQLDTTGNEFDTKRTSQRMFVNNRERDAFKAILADEMTTAYLLWWDMARKNSAPKWFREQWESGARNPEDFDAPAEVLKGASPK